MSVTPFTNQEQFVQTLHPGKKPGIRMDLANYNMLKFFILDVLRSDNAVDLNDLINQAQAKFGTGQNGQMSKAVYYVKLDLEVRGIIRQQKIIKSRKASTLVRLTEDPSSGKLQNQRTKRIRRDVQLTNAVTQKFADLFSKKPLLIFSPGRINLIGEHTDYNNGFVMPAAIDQGVLVAIGRSSARESLIYSLKYKKIFSVDHTALNTVRGPAWANYVLAIMSEYQKKELCIEPFNCVFDGDLPLGSGLSSSAAMACAFAYAFNELHHFGLGNWDIINLAQSAEVSHIGIQCGIMDQFASIMGKKDHVIVLDCQHQTYNYMPLEMNEHALVLCDTNVKHSLAASIYNLRREECELGVQVLKSRYPEVRSLRDVSLEMIENCRHLLSDNVFNRCMYVIQENKRVLEASEYLAHGKLRQLGQKMFETHDGLSKLYQVSCPELDFLVVKARMYKGVLGARMMGSGFGGCTLNIVHSDFVQRFIASIKRDYIERFKIELSCNIVSTGNGTSITEDNIQDRG